MLELKIVQPKATHLYDTKPRVECSIATKELTGTFNVQVQFTDGEGYTRVCGTRRWSDLSAYILSSNPVTGHDALLKCLVKNNLFGKLRDKLLESLAICGDKWYPGQHIMFGGRVNISPVKYKAQLGVYCGSFASYLAKNKIGTITASHAHQNYAHRSLEDFSVQQFFIWSPPSSWVLPPDPVYAGISYDPKHVADSVMAIKNMGKNPSHMSVLPRHSRQYKDERFDLMDELTEAA